MFVTNNLYVSNGFDQYHSIQSNIIFIHCADLCSSSIKLITLKKCVNISQRQLIRQSVFACKPGCKRQNEDLLIKIKLQSYQSAHDTYLHKTQNIVHKILLHNNCLLPMVIFKLTAVIVKRPVIE